MEPKRRRRRTGLKAAPAQAVVFMEQGIARGNGARGGSAQGGCGSDQGWGGLGQGWGSRLRGGIGRLKVGAGPDRGWGRPDQGWGWSVKDLGKRGEVGRGL